MAETVEIRTCRCGCGAPLTSPRAEFIRGHNVRGVPRTGPRGAVAPVRELALCACGCGQRVLTLGGRYLRGHFPRPPAAGGAILTCGACNKRVRVSPSQVATWRGCSEACVSWLLYVGLRRNRLQGRCLERMREQGLTLKALAGLAGLTQTGLDAWFRRKGRRLRRASLAKLAACLGISEAQALAEAGGVTAEERWSELARRRLDEGLAEPGRTPTPEARAKMSAAQRGKPKSPEHRAAIKAALRVVADLEVRRELAATVRGLFTDPARRERLAEAGYDRVTERFDIERTVERLLPLLVGREAPAPRREAVA